MCMVSTGGGGGHIVCMVSRGGGSYSVYGEYGGGVI